MHDNIWQISRSQQKSCLLGNPVLNCSFMICLHPLFLCQKSMQKTTLWVSTLPTIVYVYGIQKERTVYPVLCYLSLTYVLFSKPFSMWKWFMLHLWFLKYIYISQAYLEGLHQSKWTEDPKRNLKSVKLNLCLHLAADSVKGLQLVRRALTCYQNCGWLDK